MARIKVKPTQRRSPGGAGSRKQRNPSEGPRRKSRRGHAKTRSGQPRSPSLR